MVFLCFFFVNLGWQRQLNQFDASICRYCKAFEVMQLVSCCTCNLSQFWDMRYDFVVFVLFCCRQTVYNNEDLDDSDVTLVDD